MTMKTENRLPLALLLLRLSVFVVMFVWTIDKFGEPHFFATQLILNGTAAESQIVKAFGVPLTGSVASLEA